MATGRQAFSGASVAVIFDAILHQPPAPPLSLNPELPAELDRIISKSLEKDRDLRCQTAAELRADLKRLQHDTSSGRAATAPAVSDRSPAAETSPLQPGGTSRDRVLDATPARRRKKGLFLGVAAALTLIAALAYVFRPALPPHQGVAAAAEFQKILNHSGIALNEPIAPRPISALAAPTRSPVTAARLAPNTRTSWSSGKMPILTLLSSNKLRLSTPSCSER